jgi:hypothetical protein
MHRFVVIISKLLPILFTLLAVNCQKEEISPRDYPRINTLEVANINDSGATFRAEFIYPGNSTISDHGFIWGLNEDITLLNAEKVSLGGTPGKGSFSATVNYSLNPNTVYNVKAYVVTDRYTVYGKEVKFTSLGCLAPVIFDINPKHGSDGDTIKISGTNFTSLTSNIKIMFGEDQAEIIGTDKNEITLIIPIGYKNPGYISIDVWINEYQLEIKDFLLDSIKFENIYPQIAKIPNTEIEITCNTIIRDIQKLSLGDFNINIFQNIDNKIFFQIPPNSPVGYVRINAIINNKSVVSTDSVLLISPWIKRSSCPMNEGMFITQRGFVINNRAYFYANPVATWSESGEIWEYNPTSDSWTFCNKFPDMRLDPFALAINEKGYVGAGWCITEVPENNCYNDVYEFSPENKSWTQVESLPVIDGICPIGFPIDTDAYVFGGSNYYKYNQTADSWITIGSCEEAIGLSNCNFGSTGFEIDGKIYIGSGDNTNEFWCFNTSSGIWSKIADLPSIPHRYPNGFSINGNGYIILGRSLWIYNPDENIWEELANFPAVDKNEENYYAMALSLVIMGKAYVTYDHELWEFNPDF